MKGLLIKDGYMILKQGKYYLIFNILYSVLAVSASTPVFFVLFNVILNCMIVKTLMAYEEQNRWSSLCVNLPVTVSSVVWEKYIAGTCCALVANVISFTIIRAAQWMGKFEADIPLLPLFLLYIAVALLYLALELPVLFKFGVNEGRIWFVMATALAAGLGAGTGTMIVERVGETVMLSERTLTLVMCVLIIAAACAVYISGKLSIRIYKKKEI